MKLKAAVAQICSGSDPWSNLFQFQSLIEEAETRISDLICFPENLFYRGPRKTLSDEFIFRFDSKGSLLCHSAFTEEVRDYLKGIKLAVSMGSVLERSEDPQRPYNTHLFYDPSQRKFTRYRKLHLFRFQSHHAQTSYSEDQTHSPGNLPMVVDYKGFKIGLSICFDLRFPELYRKMTLNEAASLHLVPAAFTRETGKVHWHTLLRARAIENLSYILAAGQWGTHLNDHGQRLECYGHSLAVGPWGEILKEAPLVNDALLSVILDSEEIAKRRSQLPALKSFFFSV